MDEPAKYSDAATIFVKILGGIAVVVSFRWVSKIFAGPDGKFSVTEFGRMTGFFFLLTAAGAMLYVEGTRVHEWQVFSELYIAIIFGSLLTVLHLDAALDKILKIMQAAIELRRGAPQPQPPKLNEPATTSAP